MRRKILLAKALGPAKPNENRPKEGAGTGARARVNSIVGPSMKVLPGPITCAKDKLIGEKLGPCAEPVHSDPWLWDDMVVDQHSALG
jgi:hypothetical protein